MPTPIQQVPTNLILGFLGVGKTTAILNLLRQKPRRQKWAVLVNEFGEIGIDGAIYAKSGAVIKEIPGGCLCCAVGLPFQTAINRLLRETRPDRLLIEPTGLGHPKKVLDMLNTGFFRQTLDVRASICLVDPRKLSDKRYLSNENFVDQMQLADILIANKTDLANEEDVNRFNAYAQACRPPKTVISETINAQLELAWLDLASRADRTARFPHAHNRATTQQPFQTCGFTFDRRHQFNFACLETLLMSIQAERIKGIFFTEKGWYLFNIADGSFESHPCQASADSRVEIISTSRIPQDFRQQLLNCVYGNKCHRMGSS